MLTHPLLPKLRQLKLGGMVLTLDTRALRPPNANSAPWSSWPCSSTTNWNGAASSAWLNT